MKKKAYSIVALVIALMMGLNAQAQKYSSRLTEGGMMYFFMPVELTENVTVKNSELEYDVTLLSNSDSVTVNMTLIAQESAIGRVSITSGTEAFETKEFELFFQDKKGKNIKSRIHIDVPYERFCKIFKNESEPLTLTIDCETASYAFTCKRKTWKKICTAVDEVTFSAESLRKRHTK